MSPLGPNPNQSDDKLSWFVIKVTLMASIGGCLFGYDMGAIAGALPQLKAYFDLSDSQAEWVVSILYLGGGLGATVGGTCCDVVGRQRSIVITDVIFMVGAAMLFFSSTLTEVYFGRLVVGFAIAVSGVADVSYLHEIAPPNWRGAIVSVNEACISLGFMLAFLAGWVYSGSEDNNEEWRYIFGWAGVVAFVQLLGMWHLPESPTWLLEKGRIEESNAAWERIHGRPRENESDVSSPEILVGIRRHEDPLVVEDDDHQGEEQNPTLSTTNATQNQDRIYDRISSALVSSNIETEIENQCPSTGNKFMGKLTDASRILLRYRQQVYIALFLSVTQQLCGQASVLNYAPIIFAQVSDEDQEVDQNVVGSSTMLIGLVKFVVTVLVIWKIEYLGRRFLLLLGMVTIAIGQLCLIVAFGGYTNPDAWSPTASGFQLALPGVMLVVCGYSMSFGPLTWLLTSELFPTEIRGRALGTSTIVTYLSAALVTNTFLSAQNLLGPSKVFALYFIVTAMGLVFSYLAIPDTGSKSVEEIESAIRQMWWWRFDSVLLESIEVPGPSRGDVDEDRSDSSAYDTFQTSGRSGTQEASSGRHGMSLPVLT